MANEYVSSSELKATLELTGETFADADIALALTAASRGIDNTCNRRFYADADANQVRYYSPPCADHLWIDDLVTFTSLATDPGGDGTFEETWTQNTDFVLEPLNASADSEPFTAIRVHPSGSYYLPTDYPRTVKLTAKFGWAAVPEEVEEATTIVATKLLRRAREAPFGVVSVGLEGAAVRITRSDPDVAWLLNDFIRQRIPVA